MARQAHPPQCRDRLERLLGRLPRRTLPRQYLAAFHAAARRGRRRRGQHPLVEVAQRRPGPPEAAPLAAPPIRKSPTSCPPASRTLRLAPSPAPLEARKSEAQPHPQLGASPPFLFPQSTAHPTQRGFSRPRTSKARAQTRKALARCRRISSASRS